MLAKMLSYKRSWLYGVLLLTLSPGVPSLAAQAKAQADAKASAEPIRLDNGHLRIGLDRGNGRLVELLDLRTGQDFVAHGSDSGSPWQLVLAGEEASLTPADARTFRSESVGDLALRLAWEDFDIAGAPELRVLVSVEMANGEPLSEWDIAIEGPDEVGIESVLFPRLPNIAPLGEEERLAVPRFMGELARNPRELFAGSDGQGRRRTWSYPGELALQALAVYQEGGPGFYAAADDTAGYRKAFAVWGDGQGGLGFEVVHLLEDPGTPRDGYAPTFSGLLGTFEGDWITAAERYRAWGTRQVWARESRLRRGLVPTWLLDTGLWLWNRGRAEGVLRPALTLQRELGLPVSVHWHWWHGGAYDTSFPEYLPPRDGAEPFRAALREAQAEGVRAIVYMNQRLWCTGTRSWEEEGAEPFAVKNRDGSLAVERPNAFDRQPCARMCITQPFWHEVYGGLAETLLLDYGVDGIYMDQAVASMPCYDPRHGHPLGGGNYWIEGFGTLAQQIRERASRKTDVLLAGEHAAENWLPLLDLFLTLQISQERYIRPGGEGWDVIPFFQAVYHAYGVTYGSYSSLSIPPYDELWPRECAPARPLELLDRKYSRQFYLEQARAFVWGMQPTVANFLPSQFKERPEEVAYMVRLARVRSRALDYLLHGTFRRPPKLEVPEIDVELSRLSIYAGRRGGGTSWSARFPALLVAAWGADDGDLAIVLASIVDEPLSLSFEVEPGSYGLIGGGRIYRMDESGREAIGEFGEGPVPLRFEFPALGAWVLEFSTGGAGSADAIGR
ncbi:MAG: hypothetical protein AMS25_02425 [Gemmatimonas sp. SM23_52]|nr:MAG: hypothetical protein AMS25_02425 [Gemmatimonas sp. SM23_52]